MDDCKANIATGVIMTNCEAPGCPNKAHYVLAHLIKKDHGSKIYISFICTTCESRLYEHHPDFITTTSRAMAIPSPRLQETKRHE